MDPLREGGGLNYYAYCGNDPVNRHDPLGLADDDFWGVNPANLARIQAHLREDHDRYGWRYPKGAIQDPTEIIGQSASVGHDTALGMSILHPLTYRPDPNNPNRVQVIGFPDNASGVPGSFESHRRDGAAVVPAILEATLAASMFVDPAMLEIGVMTAMPRMAALMERELAAASTLTRNVRTAGTIPIGGFEPRLPTPRWSEAGHVRLPSRNKVSVTQGTAPQMEFGFVSALESNAAKVTISNPGPRGFVLVGEGSLHSTVAVRKGSLVNRVFDSGFATNPIAAQPLGRYFGEGGVIPTSANSAISARGLNLPGIVNDAQLGAVYRANTHIPALRGPAAGGTGPELIIERNYFRNLELQGGYVPIVP